MKYYKRIWFILKQTKAINIFLGFVVLCFFAAVILKWIEPSIKTIGDGLWYSFIAATTIGFGDFYATTTLGRIITIFLSLNGMFVFAMMTGVVVSMYQESLNYKENESVALFIQKLENLENLSKSELKEISEKVKKLK